MSIWLSRAGVANEYTAHESRPICTGHPEAIVEQWQETLSSVADALAQGNTLAALNDPNKELNGRLTQLGKLVPSGTSTEIKNFLNMLAQAGDLDLLPPAMASLRSSLSDQAEPQEAEIVSAVELARRKKNSCARN